MLTALGHEVEVVSRLRTALRSLDETSRLRTYAKAQIQAICLIQRYRRRRVRPDLWITYHPYAKAPDLLGPLVAMALELPYVVIDGTIAYKYRRSSFRDGLALTRAALRRCDALFFNKPIDQLRAERLVRCPHLYLPPSVDLDRFASALPIDLSAGAAGPVIGSLAMFRSGRKVDSLKLLAEALEILHERSPDEPWLAVIGGGGPAREEALAAFSSLPRNRVRFFGLVPTEDVPAFMKGCDIFAFPGLAEPLGLVFLEAQATGLPVVAVRNEGIASVSSPDGTILLNSSRPAAYADALMELIADPERRRQMGNTALRFVAMERSRTVAQARLAEGLAAAIEHHKLQQVSVQPSSAE